LEKVFEGSRLNVNIGTKLSKSVKTVCVTFVNYKDAVRMELVQNLCRDEL